MTAILNRRGTDIYCRVVPPAEPDTSRRACGCRRVPQETRPPPSASTGPWRTFALQCRAAA
jgi:hypothetical protein